MSKETFRQEIWIRMPHEVLYYLISFLSLIDEENNKDGLRQLKVMLRRIFAQQIRNVKEKVEDNDYEAINKSVDDLLLYLRALLTSIVNVGEKALQNHSVIFHFDTGASIEDTVETNDGDNEADDWSEDFEGFDYSA